MKIEPFELMNMLWFVIGVLRILRCGDDDGVDVCGGGGNDGNHDHGSWIVRTNE